MLIFLCKERLIHLWSILFQYKTRFRIFFYVMSAEADASFFSQKSEIQVSIEYIVLEENRVDVRAIKKDPKNIISHQKLLLNAQCIANSTNQFLNYGLMSKFIWFSTLQELLIYLTYEYKSKSTELNQEELVIQFNQNNMCHHYQFLFVLWVLAMKF